MTTIAIRADASRAIGLGHVKRCLALAAALRERGATVRFVARAGDVDLQPLLAAAGFELLALPGPPHRDRDAACPGASPPPQAGATAHRHWLPVPPEADAADTVAALAAAGPPPSVVVVDHYAIDAAWHHAVRAATGAAIVVIDDLADRALAADLVIDHNPAADHRAKYAAVLRRPARMLSGPSVALLDAAYRRQRPRPFHAQVQRIGIFMGGTDPKGHSLLAWQACREHARWRGPIEIATTSAHPQLDALAAIARRDDLLEVRLDAPNLAAFHASHDLQIGAGGGALWERCALGVPTIAVMTAANQRLSVPRLASTGVVAGFDAIDPGPGTAAELGRLVTRLIDCPAERAAMRQRSMSLVDGRGAERAAQAVLALLQPLTPEPCR